MEDLSFGSTTFINFGNKYQVQMQCSSLFKVINGDAFYSLSQWPLWVKRIFLEKPMSDKGTFTTTLFLVGNGCSPDIVKSLVALSQYWSIDFERKALKRCDQVDWILRNATKYEKHWFYFDLHKNKYLYWNGENKLRNSSSSTT